MVVKILQLCPIYFHGDWRNMPLFSLDLMVSILTSIVATAFFIVVSLPLFHSGRTSYLGSEGSYPY